MAVPSDAVFGAFESERSLDRRSVQVYRSRWSRRGWRADWRVAPGQSRPERLGQLHGIAVPAHVHVEHRRGGSEQMIVDGVDLDAALNQPFHHGADFVLGEHQI